jgi:ABC-type glutathione transport system ATPase component
MAIARALVKAPLLYLLDEPANSIDPDSQQALATLIASIHQDQGAAMLYVTHDVANLPPACSRVVALEAGRIVRDGEPDDPAMAIRKPSAPAWLQTAVS